MKHITSLLFCLLCWLPFGISGTPENAPERVQSEFSCNLPGPSNLAASNITANSFDLDWTAVPGAWGYRVRVTDSNNNLVFDNTTTGTAMFVNGMAGGETYTATVTTLCAVGNEGGTTSASVNTDIHIEIIAGSYECPNSSIADHTVPPANSSDPLKIPFHRNVNYLAEYRIGDTDGTYFTINTIADYDKITKITQKDFGNSGDLATIQSVFPIWTPQIPLYPMPKAYIKYHWNGEELLRIRVINGDAGGADIDTLELRDLREEGPVSRFGIIECKGTGENNPRYESKKELIANQIETLIFPNPFSEQIQIRFHEDITNIAIFDTNGKQLDNIYPIKEYDRIKINTSVVVSGVYYLRISTKVSTSIHKIVKI